MNLSNILGKTLFSLVYRKDEENSFLYFKHEKGRKMFLNIVKSILIISLLTACGGGDSSSPVENENNGSRSNLIDNETPNIVGENSIDKVAPIITITGKNPLSITQYSTYRDAGATANDKIDGRVAVVVTGSVNSAKVGKYTIIYTATDKAGNKATAKRIVNVIAKGTVADTMPPVITILGKNPVTVVQNSTYKDAGATARDNVDGVVKVKSSGSVDTSVIKNYTITYTATDRAGNKAVSKRTVKVIKKVVVADITAPVITILGENPASVVQNITYRDAGATAKDTIDGVVSVKSTGTVDTSTLGEYTITYTATDKAGNNAKKIRKVNVILPPDTVAPIIKISGDNPFEISQGETFSDPGATATDDVDGVITVTPSGAVDMSTVGDYTITYTATDKAGNETNTTRTVTVKPADVVWNVSTITEFRQALEDASANGESDRIVLSKGTYNITSDGLGTLAFDDNEAFNLTIEALEGLTNKDVILDGNNSKQVFNFNNTQSSTLILKNISVIDGNSTKNGAVYTNQNIKVEDCNISNNISSTGGGFYANGTTTINNSTVSYNKASNNGAGGFYSGSITTVTNSIISYNNGKNTRYYRSTGSGGFYAGGATTVIDSTISNNSSYGSAGGFFSANTATITNSTISDNSCSDYYSASDGGGFYASSAIINDSTIQNNKSIRNGGGFYTSSSSTITNSTINHNQANNGGGFYSNSTTTNSSTISNNYAKSTGGGFYVSSATITNSIFHENNATTGSIFYIYHYNYYSSSVPSYISNNTFVKNSGSIYAQGVFVNNIFSENDEDITLVGESKIYNNYIDYNKIEDNGHNVIKKNNLQPASAGEVYLTSKYTLKAKSPVIDKGLNPSSATYKKIIGGEQGSTYNYDTGEYDIVYTQYNKMLELLKTDKVGNKRIHNSTIDMGAEEYGSSK